ncbi:MAG: OmpA family protein [Mariprofundaceae bacterium]
MLHRFVLRAMFALTIAIPFGLNPAYAITLEEVEQQIAEAEQLRAAEFSPTHYNDAKESLDKAKTLLSSGGNVDSIMKLLEKTSLYAKQASTAAQRFSESFSALVESRDRMQLAGAENLRADLVKRAEEEFLDVVRPAEGDDLILAKRKAKIARQTIHAAQVVAAREQYVRPITKTVAGARRVHARKYAPKALNRALENQRQIERLIKENPDAGTKFYTLSQQGEQEATRAMRIADIGTKLNKNPAEIENWIDTEDARMRLLGESLGIKLDRTQTPEEQLVLLRQAITDMQQNYEAQLADADGQVRDLSQKLAKYEGELSDMAEIRRKLQLKREAEAKIKRLTKLFNPNEVEILLTPDADVILRVNALNFRSGSAVIPPATYQLLDNAVKSIAIFPKRSVRVEGHTDFMGSNEYNQILSERRANAVKDYLLNRMTGSQQGVSAVGHGEEKPVANNETAAGRAKNRRIDIVLPVPKG